MSGQTLPQRKEQEQCRMGSHIKIRAACHAKAVRIEGSQCSRE